MRSALAALLALTVPCRCALNVQTDRHAASASGASHVKHQTQQKNKDVPGGPREQPYQLFEKPTVPFSYVNVKGWDDQWHSTDVAATELKIPDGHIQIPNPNDFSMKPEIIAPEDSWPETGMESAHDVDSNIRKHVFQQAASMGGARRFGPAWFMRNYKPVQAPEDKIPQVFYTYLKHVQEKSEKEEKKAGLVSLRGQGSRDDSEEGQAEAVAQLATTGAVELKQRLGDAPDRPAKVEGADDSLAIARQAIIDGDAAVEDAEAQDADIKRKEKLLVTTTTTTLYNLKP